MERSINASKVESPPFMTAGPISVTVEIILSSREPDREMKPCAMWAEKSTHKPMEMTRVLQASMEELPKLDKRKSRS